MSAMLYSCPFCFILIQFNVVESHFRLLWRYANVKRGLRVSLVHACMMWKPSASDFRTYWLLPDYYYYYLLSWITECVTKRFFHVRRNRSILVDATDASTPLMNNSCSGRWKVLNHWRDEAGGSSFPTPPLKPTWTTCVCRSCDGSVKSRGSLPPRV